ncbi:hypothetical protein K6T13_05050 [Nocardioides coralli]|nr:hypothetical protein K6T13_05050 [Nocardioides coralli]
MDGDRDECPVHGAQPRLWRPRVPAYEAFAEHLRTAGRFPTLLPWPLSPGWSVSDFGVVVDGADRTLATVTCCSGTTEVDGRVDVLVVAEEAGVGLGGRCAGLPGADPGADFGQGPPAARLRVGSQSVPVWPVSTSHAAGDLDRSVVAGEADGRWLWLVMHPASAILLLQEEWLLRDVSGIGPPLVELPFSGPGPDW